MPNPNRTLTIAINQPFSSAVDQVIQLREAAFFLKSLAVAAGWSVVRSSDGANAGAADFWTSAAVLRIDTTGSGAWCALSSPPGWASATAQILLYINNAATGIDPTPQGFSIRGTTGVYSGGSTSALPTASAAETAVSSAGNILGHTSPIDIRYATWRSSRGDFMFGIKPVGSGFFTTFIAVVSNADGNGGGIGANRWWVTQLCNGTSVFTPAFLGSASYTSSLSSGGAAVVSTQAYAALAWSMTSWTAGLNFAGETIMDVVTVGANGVANGRQLGQWIDMYAVPPLLGFGTLDDSESAQVQRRVSVGAIALYAPSASLPYV